MSADVGDCIDELVGRASRTQGGHLSIGRAGFTLHYDRGCTLSGYDPMIAVGHAADESPWHALSYVPLRIVAEAYRAAGAEVLNMPGSPAPTGRS